MSKTNYLSGYSIDNSMNYQTNSLFTNLNSGDCYLGFSRGNTQNQWGINSLIQIEQLNGFPNNIVKSQSDISTNKFCDINSLKYVNNTLNRNIIIRKYSNSDTTFQSAIPFGNVGDNLNLVYMNNDWVLISGLSYDYYNYITYSSTASYYIMNKNSPSSDVMVKISNKYLTNIPIKIVDSLLYMTTSNGVTTLIQSNIQTVSNILGDLYVKGLRNTTAILESDIDSIFNMSSSASYKKNILKNSIFTLRDSQGKLLFDNLQFVDPNPGSYTNIYQESTVPTSGISEKYLTFSYTYDGNVEYIKFLIGTKDKNDVAIWNEKLPYNTVYPVSDVNPPALDITYLKNFNITNSIFDVNGMVKLDPSVNGEIEFVKEIYNNSSSAEYTNKGFIIKSLVVTGSSITHVGTVKNSIYPTDRTDIIYLEDYHSFVVGDTVYIKNNPNDNSINPIKTLYSIIEVNRTLGQNYIKLNKTLVINHNLPIGVKLISNLTNILTNIMLATTTDIKLALKNNFTNVKISKNIPLIGSNSPTEGIYRQLFICYSPFDSSGAKCTLNTYNNDNLDLLFNQTNWSYDLGLLLYIANKQIFYRKWAVDSENITIIL